MGGKMDTKEKELTDDGQLLEKFIQLLRSMSAEQVRFYYKFVMEYEKE